MLIICYLCKIGQEECHMNPLHFVNHPELDLKGQALFHRKTQPVVFDAPVQPSVLNTTPGRVSSTSRCRIQVYPVNLRKTRERPIFIVSVPVPHLLRHYPENHGNPADPVRLWARRLTLCSGHRSFCYRQQLRLRQLNAGCRSSRIYGYGNRRRRVSCRFRQCRDRRRPRHHGECSDKRG